ncbi:sigma-70 family RNA polymerase sigma factor [Clostridium hydrogenum]|uniref:sigma-70 family RNA polymerase sigma factor n=1 Tax=Clostridium hydrogenum TaxID=2855764 RepID=UPI001F406C40|nr:sigma-70 family RNA polymerase sigma factor [Clostridium hydrogenum]
MKIDDKNFIKQLKNKNPKAMDYIVDIYSNLLYKVVYSIIFENHGVNSVEECTSDVFMAIWDNIDCFDTEKGSFKTWIMTIAKFKAIDYKRKLMKHCDYTDIDDLNLASGENIENAFILKEKRNEILSAINEMKKPDKYIFIKRYFLNEDIDSIAESLSLTRAAVDNRLSRGRKLLKSKLIKVNEEVI